MVRIRMELLTPAFTKGALDPEFRVSAIRGLMRWWFRAVAHGVVRDRGSENHVKDVWELESKIFGNTDSRGIFSIYPISQPTLTSFRLSPSKKINEGGVIYSWRYLTLGLEDSRRRGGNSLIGDLEIGIRFHPLASVDQRRVVLAALGILGALGSIGRRSRRGFGSLCIKKVNGSGFEDLEDLMVSSPFRGDKVRALLNELEEAISRIFSKEGRETADKSCPKFPLLSSKNLRIKIGPSYNSYEDALNEIAFKLRRYREIDQVKEADHIKYRVTRQYSEVKGVAQSRRGEEVDLPLSAFGLPHQYYFKSLRGTKVIIKGRSRERNERYERRASPIMFKVIRPDDDKYAPLALLVESTFLPEGAELLAEVRYSKQGRSGGKPEVKIFTVSLGRAPDLKEVERFFESLDWAVL